MVTRAIISLGVLATLAGVVQAQQPSAPVKSCVPANPKLTWAIWPTPEDSAPLADIISFERRLQSAPETSHPAILIQLGRLKSRLMIDEPYAKGRPKEFFYQELAGAWLYNGWHFQEILRRYPDSQFADDAAYGLTLLPQGGECEGYVPCQVASLWTRLEPFLRKYPQSPYADSAVQRTLLAFSAIKPGMDLTRPSRAIDPPEIEKLVNSLEEVANTLPQPHRFTLLARVVELREQLGDLPAARSTARVIVDMRVGKLSECMAAHLRHLEWRLAQPY